MKIEQPHITDIFELKELNKLVSDFSKKFKFCAFILDSNGSVLVEKPFVPDYCKDKLKDKGSAEKCFKDTRRRITKTKILVEECWAGYRKIVVPMKFFNNVIAYWITCGVPDSIDDRFVKALANVTDSFVNNFLKTYEKWWKEREFIVTMLNELISEKDYDALLTKIVSAATKTLKTDRTTLFIYDGEKLVSKIAEGIDQEIALKLGEGVAGKCAVKREIVTVDNVTRSTGIKVVISDYKVKNLICAPIIFKKKLLGVIESFNKEGSFTGKDKNLISYLADAAAIALNNAQTFLALERLSIIDPLTQLHNRSYFSKCLEREMTRLNRYDGSLAIIFLDVDDFKKLNDDFGHTVGDIVLRELANVIKISLREADVAARFGGEEFVIMLPNTDREGTYTTAVRLQETIKNTPLAGNNVTVSMGIANYHQGLTPKSLIDRADKAMYRVKKTEKGNISFWD